MQPRQIQLRLSRIPDGMLQPFQYSRKKEIDSTIYRNLMIHDEREGYAFVTILHNIFYIREEEREMFIFADGIFTYFFLSWLFKFIKIKFFKK